MAKRTSNAEHFAALVAHPYGLAAMEIVALRARTKYLGRPDIRGRVREALIGAALDAIRLRNEVAEARARSRGRA